MTTFKAPDSNMPNKKFAPSGRPKFGQKGDMRRKAGKNVVSKARETYGKTGGTEAPSIEKYAYDDPRLPKLK